MQEVDGLTTEERVALGGGTQFYWSNNKTGERTLQHPGKKLFQANRKALRKRAEQKFQSDILDLIDSQKIAYNQQVFKRHGSLGYEIWSIGRDRVLSLYR